jgi:hypothetical protein
MILQIRNKILEFDKKDENIILSHIRPEGEFIDDVGLEYVRRNLEENGVYFEIHKIKPFEKKEFWK